MKTSRAISSIWHFSAIGVCLGLILWVILLAFELNSLEYGWFQNLSVGGKIAEGVLLFSIIVGFGRIAYGQFRLATSGTLSLKVLVGRRVRLFYWCFLSFVLTFSLINMSLPLGFFRESERQRIMIEKIGQQQIEILKREYQEGRLLHDPERSQQRTLEQLGIPEQFR
ncbi:MAG: hypothetical protein HYT47_02230 [Candidatus Vogelbacteria bacterium]|nr:hypothetical protein [Candidatus Vogelbacteria bacterium]